MQARYASSVRFHLIGFTSSLTLSSKCFSTFPHGTCSLSVSWSYSVLDEVYHPLWAAIPNNPTPRHTKMCWHTQSIVQVLHLLWSPSQGKLERIGQHILATYTLHLIAPGAQRFSAGLFPVHSPLLRESLLVSFPPLTDMLKFSGCSRLSSGRKFNSERCGHKCPHS
jgi:hypothetical protein